MTRTPGLVPWGENPTGRAGSEPSKFPRWHHRSLGAYPGWAQDPLVLGAERRPPPGLGTMLSARWGQPAPRWQGRDRDALAHTARRWKVQHPDPGGVTAEPLLPVTVTHTPELALELGDSVHKGPSRRSMPRWGAEVPLSILALVYRPHHSHQPVCPETSRPRSHAACRGARLVSPLLDDTRAAPGRLFSPLFRLPGLRSPPPLTCGHRLGPGTRNS